jgi:hypothetical protein
MSKGGSTGSGYGRSPYQPAQSGGTGSPGFMSHYPSGGGYTGGFSLNPNGQLSQSGYQPPNYGAIGINPRAANGGMVGTRSTATGGPGGGMPTGIPGGVSAQQMQQVAQWQNSLNPSGMTTTRYQPQPQQPQPSYGGFMGQGSPFRQGIGQFMQQQPQQSPTMTSYRQPQSYGGGLQSLMQGGGLASGPSIQSRLGGLLRMF